jgi:hypothetical protein
VAHTIGMSTRPASARRVLPGSPFNAPPSAASPADELAVDDQVTHDRYGLGRVVGTEGGGFVLVDFGSAVRRVATVSPKLIKL